jgi:hypothetical protein
MKSRLNSKLSQHYLKSLKQVKDFAFNPQPVGETSTNKTTRDYGCETKEFENDRTIMDISHTFSTILLNSDGTPISIPNILLAAQNMDEELYTDATCMEFHQLLVMLLDGFEATVTNMSNKPSRKDNLIKGRLYGYVLLRMARGRAFRMHMENIEHLLSNYTPDTETSFPAEGEQEGEDENDELEATHGSLSKSYVAWLRLMVVHFDAIEILLDFVNGYAGKQYETISIKVLLPPTTIPKALEWTKLFTYLPVFPEIDQQNPNSITKSNAEIEQFLKTAIEKANFISKTHDQAKRMQTSWNASKLMQTREALNKLTEITSSSPNPIDPNLDLKEHLKRLNWLEKQQRNPLVATNQDEITRLKSVIGENISSICNIYNKPLPIDEFYLSFEKEDTFSGTIHCEAYLAALLDNFTEHFDDIDRNYVDTQIFQEMKVDPLIFLPSDSHYVASRRVMDE